MSLSLPRRSRALRAAATSTIAVASASCLVLSLSGSASAATNSGWIAAPNGMVGVSENVTIYAPNAKGQVVTVGFQNGPAAYQQQTTIASSGYGTVAFTPNGAGTWTVNGLGSIISAGSDNFYVAAAPTYTVLLAQNNITQGQNNNLEAIVISPLSTLAPAGNVYFSTTTGNGIGTAPLYASTAAPNVSIGITQWNPGFTGQTPITAAYQPASGNQGASTSPISSPMLTTANNPVSLRFPATLSLNQQTVLQAVLGYGYNDGSVAFYLDGNGISPSIPTVNGVATFAWTPNVTGVHNITVAYTSKQLPNGSYQSGTTYQSVNIQGPLSADNITVDPPGSPAWSIAAPIQMTAGSTLSLAGTSQSGTPVIFSETGPCVISGATLRALSAGTCQVTAESPGNASLTPGSETYSVTINAAPTRRPRR